MSDLKFSAEDRKMLNHERSYHPHPRVQLKMEVLWLKSQNLPVKLICKLADISPNTLREYCQQYQTGGIEKLKQINFNRPKSELEQHQTTIRQYLESNPPANVNQAAQHIENLTGIKRSPSQIRKFLKSIGMRCLKVGAIPSKADPDEQEEYKREKLEPRLEQAKLGERAVFFVDAAHFVMGAFLGMIWCFQRLFIKSPSGRQRFNVLGALNAITHEVILVTNDSYITAIQVCELLQKLAEFVRSGSPTMERTQAASLGLSIPITLVLDNARVATYSGTL
jgi:transposase